MNEQEAIEHLKLITENEAYSDRFQDVCKLAIQALEAIQTMKERNITPENILEYAKFEDECVEKGFTFKSLLEAREKQTPQKPILKSGESIMHINKGNMPHEWRVNKWQDWVCPCCGWFVGQRYNAVRSGGKPHPHDQRKSDYCNECGQRIDWSKEE